MRDDLWESCTLSKSVSSRWENVKESTRKAGEERGMRFRQEQNEGGGGDSGSGHEDRATFAAQVCRPCVVEGEKGGGGEQREGEVGGGGGRRRKWM